MAQYPGGMYDNRSSKIRVLMYAGASVIVAAAAIVVLIFLRRPSSSEGQSGSPEPAAVQTQEPVAAEPAGGQPRQVGESAEGGAATKPADTVEPNELPQTVVPAVATSSVAMEPNRDTGRLIAQAMALVNQPAGQKIIEARDRFNELLPMVEGPQRAFVKEQLAQLSEKWLFSRIVLPDDKLCTNYKVSPGDAMEKIGRNYNVPYEILLQINGIDRPELLQAGATIKVINGPFHARVYRKTFTMDLYLQNTYVKSFAVGLGKPGQETPTGRWRVAQGGKLVKPRWTDPDTGRTYEPQDPDYPLGSRWIGLEGLEGDAFGKRGFAIHGTKDPQQIGSPGSRGCIRLHNGDAILVYNLLMPGVSLVDVVD